MEMKVIQRIANGKALIIHLVSIGKPSALIELSIVSGRMYGLLSVSILQLKGLHFLAINRNFISKNIPLQLRRLKTLDLNYNQLTGGILHPLLHYAHCPYPSFSLQI
ncbi:hypothetical protein F3Y22_tig00111758pilonHSYRG00115 [Hibiscus syriacus]|uniref:Uncharacterized protein n=1 Tax=Hibiscus syriacus TaxID=106335 RepID=A0A6A2YGA5_HIBSY|nr:hypothetical protein F3Y22_tig00111758pilonHSYRG00115 [Hibiscus syriacus]